MMEGVSKSMLYLENTVYLVHQYTVYSAQDFEHKFPPTKLNIALFNYSGFKLACQS